LIKLNKHYLYWEIYYKPLAKEKRMHSAIHEIKDGLENPTKVEKQGKL